MHSTIYLILLFLSLCIGDESDSVQRELQQSPQQESQPTSVEEQEKAVEPNSSGENELPVYTLEMLRRYDGSDPSLPVYLGLQGKVFDVSSGSKFYAKGKAYAHFAGRDVTRNTAMFSTEYEDLDRTDFPPEYQTKLDDVVKKTYMPKYPIVGTFINNNKPPPEPERPPSPDPVSYDAEFADYTETPEEPSWIEENMTYLLISVYIGAMGVACYLLR